MTTCPACQRLNPGDVEICECGHRLGVHEESPARFTLFGTTIEEDPPTQFSMFGTIFQGSKVVQSPASEDAKLHLGRSLKLTIIVSGVVLGLGMLSGDVLASFVGAAICAYLTWASYWGILGVVRRLTGYFENGVPNTFLGHFIVEFIGGKEGGGGLGWFILPVFLGIVFGIFGGGIGVYLRYQGIAENPDNEITPD